MSVFARRVARVVAAVLAFVLMLGGSVILVNQQQALANGDVDLVSELTVQNSAYKEEVFEHTASISNISLSTAEDVTFNLNASGVTYLSVICEQASGGAVCPSSITVNSASAKGTILSIPQHGKIKLKFSGRYGSTSSATFELNATPKVGVIDTDLSSNLVSQQVALQYVDGSGMSVHKELKSSPVSSNFGYIIKYQNNGSSNLTDVPLHDRLTSQPVTNVSYSFIYVKVTGASCASETNIPCPSWVSDLLGTIVYTGYTTPLFNKKVDFPAGKKLVLDISFEFLQSSACGISYTVLNTASLDYRDSKYNIADSSSSAASTFTINGTSCSVQKYANWQVSKAADKYSANVNEKVTFTIKYQNYGGLISNFWIYDALDPLSTGWSYKFKAKVYCDMSASTVSVCPISEDNNMLGTHNEAWSDRVYFFDTKFDFAPSSTLVIKVEYTPTKILTGVCGSSVTYTNMAKSLVDTSVYNSPYFAGAKESKVTVSLSSPTSCPYANVTASISADKNSAAYGEYITYSLTYTNHSSIDINNAQLRTEFMPYTPELYRYYITHTFAYCDSGASTAGCGDLPTSISGAGTATKRYVHAGITRSPRLLFTGREFNLPAGKSIVLKVGVKLEYDRHIDSSVPMTCPGHNSAVFLADFLYPFGVTGYVPRLTANSSYYCGADVSTTTAISNSLPNANSSLVVTSTVTASENDANNVPITIQLPELGFVATGQTSSPECQASSAVCPTTWQYDAANHRLTGTAPTIYNGGSLTIRVRGKSGVVPPKTASYIVTTTAPVPGDNKPVNNAPNRSDATFGLVNTQTSLFVEQRLNIPAPEAITVQGVADCVDPDRDGAFTIIIPQGQTLFKVLYSDEIWKGDSCKITMTRPAPPAGYVWDDAPAGGTVVDGFEPNRVQNANNITAPRTVRFKLFLKPKVSNITPPPLPLTGGTSADSVYLGGGMVFLGGLIATGLVVSLRRRGVF